MHNATIPRTKKHASPRTILKSFFFSLTDSKKVSFLGLFILMLTLPLVVIVNQKKQTVMQHAAGNTNPLLFGTNLGLFDDTDYINNIPAQNSLNQLHVTILRIPWRQSKEDPSGSRLVSAVRITHTLGVTPLVILPVDATAAIIAGDKQIIQQLNPIMNGSKIYYEIGNEAFDVNYLTNWNTIVPQLAPIAQNAFFIGPAAAANYTDMGGPGAMATFWHNANPKPYALSWHEYPCKNSDSAQVCLDQVDTTPLHNWGVHMADTIVAIHALGDTVPPIFITEWNYDSVPPANDPRFTPQFQQQFTTRALNQLAKEGVTEANHYDLNTNSFFNLINADGSFTPEGTTFQQIYAQLIGNSGGNTPSPTSVQSPTPNPTSPVPTPTPTTQQTPTPTINPCTSITPTSSQISTTPNPTAPQNTPTPTPGPPVGNLSVHFEGIDPSNNPSPHHPQRIVVLSFYQTQNFTGAPITAIQTMVTFSSSDTNGAFINSNVDISSIPIGNYYVLIKSPEGSLQELLNNAQPLSIARGQTTFFEGQNNAQPTNLRMGDLNADNVIDVRDYNIVVDCYGGKQTGPACINHNITDKTKGLFADLNDDGAVNGIDYNILIRHLGENGYGSTIQPAIQRKNIFKPNVSSPCDSPTPTPPAISQSPSPTQNPTPTPFSSPSPSPTGTGTLAGIHVQGNKFVDTNNQTIVLRGVDISGTETNCVQNGGIFTNPATLAGVQAMLAWHIHVVRIPLNEDCWLGINGANPGGTAYQQAISNYVTLLNQNGLYAILDLHWNAPGTTLANSQQKMADADHSPTFWAGVATKFKGNNAVIFDLYNEPNSLPDQCILQGGSCGGSFPIAGMQQLVTAIRTTGATNVLMVGGNRWANDLTGWLANKPTDTMNPPNIAAAWHAYHLFQFESQCVDVNCYNTTLAPVAAQVPIVAGEIGEGDCAHSFIDTTMNWFDSVQQSYVGWAWINSSCGGFPSLITDFAGTPTGFGAGLKAHLLTFP